MQIFLLFLYLYSLFPTISWPCVTEKKKKKKESWSISAFTYPLLSSIPDSKMSASSLSSPHISDCCLNSSAPHTPPHSLSSQTSLPCNSVPHSPCFMFIILTVVLPGFFFSHYNHTSLIFPARLLKLPTGRGLISTTPGHPLPSAIFLLLTRPCSNAYPSNEGWIVHQRKLKMFSQHSEWTLMSVGAMSRALDIRI